ncbi:MAG: hypothetical protein OEW42_04035 [Acidimicrobiia bacterium]|nr:hypothetical protein [Acidimicrobiia bacterium]MDH5236370.1 hypothetical protein [Acidimicrobiia bacterium]
MEFTEGEPEPVLERIGSMLGRARGDWVNFEPMVDDTVIGELAVRRGVAGWFSARGSDLPYATLLAPVDGARPAVGSLGLQHGGGPKAVRALTAAGITAPDGWILRQDHPKRGLVFQQQGVVDAGQTLEFVFAAARRLCPVELDGRWSAVIHLVG